MSDLLALLEEKKKIEQAVQPEGMSNKDKT